MTAIMLFALDPDAVEKLELAETSFGTADIGNKGAVAIRLLYATAPAGGHDIEGIPVDRRETELTLVAAHLAAMEWNLPIRNDNWRSIMTNLLFENPKSILPAENLKAPSPKSEQSFLDEADPLLNGDQHDVDAVGAQLESLPPAEQKRLHDSTIFKPSSHLFIAGDLNYRISAQGPDPEASFPSLKQGSEHHHSTFFAERDQLTEEMAAGRTLHGMVEAPVRFPPTYKYTVLPKGDTGADSECNTEADGNKNVDDAAKVWWQFAGHRWPSWCDRVLYREMPTWAQVDGGDAKKWNEDKIEIVEYDALPVVKTSDHRGVFLRARVPLIAPDDMVAGADGAVTCSTSSPPLQTEHRNRDNGGGLAMAPMRRRGDDTRVRLPAPVDRDAWIRREAARKKEVALGWSMILWGTREGALALVGGCALAAAGWWLGRTYYWG